jgi:hypothetical protein
MLYILGWREQPINLSFDAITFYVSRALEYLEKYTRALV